MDTNILFDKPVRKIKNNSSKIITGVFPSFKNNRSIYFNSLLERDFIHLIEFDQNVIKYVEQPIKLHFKINNRKYSYTPDFYVERLHEKQIVEIKFMKIFTKIIENDELTKSKYLLCNRFCNQNQIKFMVVTENQIREGNLLRNIQYLFHFASYHVPSIVKLKIQNVLINSGATSIKELAMSIEDYDYNASRVFIYNLIYHHFLDLDLNNLFNDENVVTLGRSRNV